MKQTNKKASLVRHWFFMEDGKHIISIRYPKRKFIEKYYKNKVEVVQNKK